MSVEEFVLRDEWVRNVWPSSGVMFRFGGAEIDLADGSWSLDAGDGLTSWTHRATGLRLTVEATVFDDYPVIEWVPTLTNTGSTDTPIIEDWAAADMRLPTETSESWTLRYASGSLCTVDDFAPQTVDIGEASSVRFTPGAGRSSSEILPFFNLDQAGRGIVLAVGWTGEWAVSLQASVGSVHLTAGLAHTHFRLRPGESVRGPRIMMLFWDGADASRGTNLLRRFVLAHHSPPWTDPGTGVPLSALVWGTTTEDVHRQLIGQISAEKLPFEQYWVDAGWFGSGEWVREVGDWTANPAALPNGLRPISDEAHTKHLSLLVWFEPERVGAGSPWEQEHPGWLLRVPEEDRVANVFSPEDPRWVHHESRRTEIAGGEGLFNLGDDDACDFLIDFLSARIVEWGLDTYRHDFNIAPLAFWRANDAPDREGITELNYVAGLYRLFDELRSRHPNLRFDNCASGGRRIDLEMLSRADVLCRSDYVADPVGFQCHTYGLSTWLPLHATVSAAGSDRYAVRSAMASGLSLSWASVFGRADSGEVDFDYASIRSVLAELLDVRRTFLGDFYPLTEYSSSASAWLGCQFDLPERGDGVALLFRRAEAPDSTFVLRLRGLATDCSYELETDARIMHESVDGSYRGADLTRGLELELATGPSSALIRYRRSV